MALGDVLKKVFVPKNDETHVGTPENPGREETAYQQPGPGASENEAQQPGPPGEAPGAENAEGANAGVGDAGGQADTPPPPMPAPQQQEEYHYSAFGEEESTLWNQHTRIVLAIAVVLFSAMILWWILI